MSLPKVSIITVVYNNKELIQGAIQSVLKQDYSNIEYIVIDGGSSDETVSIIKSYSDRISYFISEKDNGIYDAFNKGIKVTKGQYIGIVNSDDILELVSSKLDVAFISEHENGYQGLADKDTDVITIQIKWTLKK